MGVGAIIGTPAYMSPEQLMALGDVDDTTDIYSVGVTMYECLSGKVPYAGNYTQVLLRAAEEDPAPSVRAATEGVELPRSLADVVDRAIAKRRDARFQSVSDLARAIEAAVPEASAVTALLGPPPAPKREAPVAAGPQQRRRTPRAPYNTPVRLVLEGGILDGRTEDISESVAC